MEEEKTFNICANIQQTEDWTYYVISGENPEIIERIYQEIPGYISAISDGLHMNSIQVFRDMAAPVTPQKIVPFAKLLPEGESIAYESYCLDDDDGALILEHEIADCAGLKTDNPGGYISHIEPLGSIQIHLGPWPAAKIESGPSWNSGAIFYSDAPLSFLGGVTLIFKDFTLKGVAIEVFNGSPDAKKLNKFIQTSLGIFIKRSVVISQTKSHPPR